MTQYFPAIDRNYKFIQVNRGDILGNLWATSGLDFQSNPGAIRLADKLVINTSDSDDADLGTPCAFESFGQRWFAICGTRCFKTADTDPTGTFTEDASTNAATDYDVNQSDLATFNSRLWASTNDDLLSKSSATGAWTSRATLTGGTLHKLCKFRKYNRLYYTDSGNIIYSIDENDVAAASDEDYAIVLPDNFGVVTTIQAASDAIWIGTMAGTMGTHGAVYKWDGISAQITAEYQLTSAGVLAMKIVDDLPVILDADGIFRKFNASGFTEIARFPLEGQSFRRSTLSSTAAARPVHSNGMEYTKDNTILVLLNSLVNTLDTTTSTERIDSGVWELDLSTGNLTHKHNLSLKTFASTSPTDYGQAAISTAGALKINPFEHFSTNGNPQLLAGAQVFSNATSGKYAIFVTNSLASTEKTKAGKFVTNWLKSEGIDDNWQMMWTTYRRFLNAADKMVFKYRLEEEDCTLATITWVNTTSFTTTTDITAYAQTATGFDGTYGGEVEILNGTGGGACRHITAIVNNAGTYTVTIDNAVTGVTTGTAKARFQKWKKLLPEVTGQVNSYTQFPITINSPRIQVKGYLEWTGKNEFYKFLLDNTEQTEAQA